jgi:AraC-like DNA-binding protein
VFGVPPHRYLMGRRLEHAAMLLRTTERPVMEICRTVGLRSVTSFTTLFGLTYGLPPSAYRAAHGTGDPDARSSAAPDHRLPGRTPPGRTK